MFHKPFKFYTPIYYKLFVMFVLNSSLQQYILSLAAKEIKKKKKRDYYHHIINNNNTYCILFYLLINNMEGIIICNAI